MEDLRMAFTGENGLIGYEIKPEVKNILNNIIREVDAIRGYILDPVAGDFIHDEIKHIEELCGKLRAECGGKIDADEDDEDDEDEAGEDEEEDPEEGEHY